MPTAEFVRPVGRVYKPSHAPSHLKAMELEWSKLFASKRSDVVPSHTLVTGQNANDFYSVLPFNMAPQTYSQADIQGNEPVGKSLEEVLFDAGATAKILTSRVSMYLREGWRDKLFHQLDNLLDPDEWDPEDKPLQEKSFATFLKAICDIQPSRRPGLGLAYSGNLIAGWRGNVNGEDRISLEFGADGNVKVIGTRFVGEDPVPFSFVAKVKSLRCTLVQFNCAEWLGCAQA